MFSLTTAIKYVSSKLDIPLQAELTIMAIVGLPIQLALGTTLLLNQLRLSPLLFFRFNENLELLVARFNGSKLKSIYKA
jgi:hypothetical protein